MNQLLFAAGSIIMIILQCLFYIIIASALISWVNPDPNNPIVRFINSVTEPMYRPVRKITGKIPGPLDWAPLVLLLFIQFLLILLPQYLGPLRG